MNEVLEFFPGAAAGLPVALGVAVVSGAVKSATLSNGIETDWTGRWKRVAPIFRLGLGVGLAYLVKIDPAVGLLAGGFSAEVYNLVKTRAGFKEPA